MFAIGDTEWPGISKLAEESGEVVQVIGKLMGTGGKLDHWDGSKLNEELNKEIGDLLAAIRFVVRHCPNIDSNTINERADLKLRRFEQWHALGEKNQQAIR
jgi:NTP pyrophosphatase (non-canonical NTP hydrolase)